jgi:integrase
MAVRQNSLSARFVATVTERGLYADGAGLYLQVSPTGTKSWAFIYKVRGRKRQKGLGSVQFRSLADARVKRDEMRALLLDGKDPLEVRDVPEGNPTFGNMAAALIADLEPGWKNEKHRWQWKQTLEHHCAGIWERPVASIETADVVDVLRPIWADKRETAARLRGRIEKVLDSAKVRGHRSGDNPARWRGHLEIILPQKKRGTTVRHHPAMPYGQVPDFVRGLHSRVSTAARALEFTILTVARTTETLKATWSEIDLDAKTWTVPADRMKMGVAHVVPLPEPALAVLRAMALFGTRPDRPVFPNKRGAPLSNMAMEMTLRRMECDEYTVHGFRSTFRDWAGDETDYPRDIVEMALAHQVGNAVEQAYRRGTALAKRRELMDDWGRYVAGGAEAASLAA